MRIDVESTQNLLLHLLGLRFVGAYRDGILRFVVVVDIREERWFVGLHVRSDQTARVISHMRRDKSLLFAHKFQVRTIVVSRYLFQRLTVDWQLLAAKVIHAQLVRRYGILWLAEEGFIYGLESRCLSLVLLLRLFLRLENDDLVLGNR